MYILKENFYDSDIVSKIENSICPYTETCFLLNKNDFWYTFYLNGINNINNILSFLKMNYSGNILKNPGDLGHDCIGYFGFIKNNKKNQNLILKQYNWGVISLDTYNKYMESVYHIILYSYKIIVYILKDIKISTPIWVTDIGDIINKNRAIYSKPIMIEFLCRQKVSNIDLWRCYCGKIYYITDIVSSCGLSNYDISNKICICRDKYEYDKILLGELGNDWNIIV